MSLLFMVGKGSMVCEHNTFFIYLSIVRHPSWSYNLAVVNSAAVNTGVQVSL